MRRVTWPILFVFCFLNYCGEQRKTFEDAQERPAFFLVSGTDVRMRSGPGTSNRIVKTLSFGVPLKASPLKKESTAGWVGVETSDGVSGYISNELVMGFTSVDENTIAVKKLIQARFERNSFSLREFKDFLDYLRKNLSKNAEEEDFFLWSYYSHLRSVSEYLTEDQVLQALSAKDKSFFIESESGHVFNHQFLFDFAKDYPRSPYAEEAFWNAVNSISEEDCENYFHCGLKNKLNHELTYLQRYPKGQFSERSLSALRDFLVSFPDLKKPEYPLSKVKDNPKELIGSLDKALTILESVENSEEQIALLVEIKESLLGDQ